MALMPMHKEKWSVPDLLERPKPRKFADNATLADSIRKAHEKNLRLFLLSIHAEPFQIAYVLDNREFAIKLVKDHAPVPIEVSKTFTDRAYDLIIWLGQHLP